jgi:hypothetical protein
MNPEFDTVPDDGLLDLVRMAMSMPGKLTAKDRALLESVVAEFEFRDELRAKERRQITYQRRKHVNTLKRLREGSL